MRSMHLKKIEADAESKQQIEFKKNNEVISVHVSQGRMTLLSRKIFNAMVCYAQSVGHPGVGAPVASETAKQYFWMPMADLIRDTAYNSHDTELIKQCVEELSNIKIQIEDDKEWTSERLISSVKIVNPAGLRKKGGQLYFGFAFPPEVAEHVMRPGKYTQLSLYYQTMIRSGASMSLYEVCRQYATNPSHVTLRKPWLWWYHTLSGNPITEDSVPEYKYFKRDTIKPALAEVNSITDVEVELIEHKLGRKVVDLQFHVKFKVQRNLDFSPPVVNTALIERIKLLGVSTHEAVEIITSFPEDYVCATLAFVEKRIRSQTSAKIEMPSAYFRMALKNKYVSEIEIAAMAVKLEEDVCIQHHINDGLSSDVAANEQNKVDALAYFYELNVMEQDKYLATFIESAPPHILKFFKKNQLESKIVELAFSEWLSNKLWGHLNKI